MSAAATEQETPDPIPDEYVDWFVSFLRGMEADNASHA